MSKPEWEFPPDTPTWLRTITVPFLNVGWRLFGPYLYWMLVLFMIATTLLISACIWNLFR